MFVPSTEKNSCRENCLVVKAAQVDYNILTFKGLCHLMSTCSTFAHLRNLDIVLSTLLIPLDEFFFSGGLVLETLPSGPHSEERLEEKIKPEITGHIVVMSEGERIFK